MLMTFPGGTEYLFCPGTFVFWSEDKISCSREILPAADQKSVYVNDLPGDPALASIKMLMVILLIDFFR